MELGTGNGHPKKVMELRRVFAQLTRGPIKNLGALALNHVMDPFGPQSPGALDHSRKVLELFIQKTRSAGAKSSMRHFSGSFRLKPGGWGPENNFSNDVLEHCRNLSILAHFQQFSSNRVGGPHLDNKFWCSSPKKPQSARASSLIIVFSWSFRLKPMG